MLAADPTDPIESTEPTEQIDSAEPLEQMERNESRDEIDHRESEEPGICRTERILRAYPLARVDQVHGLRRRVGPGS